MNRIASIAFLSALYACSGEKSNTPRADGKNKIAMIEIDDSFRGIAGEPSSNSAAGCDPRLWDHVYSPKRLKQISPCLSVTGVIDESNVDDDGDQHFLLKLDPGQDSLVNKRNAKKKSGDLVLEIVCANPTTMKKAKAACAGYTNSIAIPPVGAHVMVTGTYVIDSHNGWAEIHPVSSVNPVSGVRRF